VQAVKEADGADANGKPATTDAKPAADVAAKSADNAQGDTDMDADTDVRKEGDVPAPTSTAKEEAMQADDEDAVEY
jgi:hypothetical protein